MSNNEIVPGFDDEAVDGLELRLEAVAGLKGGLVFEVKGHLDTMTSPALLRKAMKAIEAGYHRLIFECSRLDFVSSTGIGTFSALIKKVRPLSGDLIILRCHSKPLATFELMGFRQYFNFVDTLEEAWEIFSTAKALPKMPTFPSRISCPVCSLAQSADKPGLYRCQGCQTPLQVDDSGDVFLAN